MLQAVDLQEGPSLVRVGRAGWADPTVYVDGSSRYPPPPPVVPRRSSPRRSSPRRSLCRSSPRRSSPPPVTCGLSCRRPAV